MIVDEHKSYVSMINDINCVIISGNVYNWVY